MDEDTFALPGSWHGLVHPRRGGIVRPVTPPGGGRKAQLLVDRWFGEHADRVEQAVTDERGDAELAAAVAAHRGTDGPDPLGAAALATALLGEDSKVRASAIADAWVEGHGLAFAARAAVELIGVTAVGNRWADGRPSVHRLSDGHYGYLIERQQPALARLRALLAAAGDDAYRDVVEALGGCRSGERRRLAVSYLLPTETDWVTECCTSAGTGGCPDDVSRTLLLCSLGSPEQLRLVPETWRTGMREYDWTLSVLATVAEGIGAEALPLAARSLRRPTGSPAQAKLVLDFIGSVPTDQAFRLLLAQAENRHCRPALWSAAQRFPERALRLLAEAAHPNASAVPARSALAGEVLPLHVTAQRALVEPALPGLAPRLAAVVAPLLDSGADRLAEAPAEALPALLVSPPWTRTRKAARPRVVSGLRPPEPELRWAEGERESWAAVQPWYAAEPNGRDMAERFALLQRGRLDQQECVALFLYGEADRVRPLLAAYEFTDLMWIAGSLEPIVGIHGLDALPSVLRAATRAPGRLGAVLTPFLDVSTARVMADWLLRLKDAGGIARAWFARHGLDAARLLVPDAVGPAGSARRRAEHALRALAAQHGAAALAATADAGYGAEAGAAVAELLAADPLTASLPSRMPVLGDWVDPALLPQVELVDGGALPEDSVRHVLTMLALSRPQEPYPGLTVVLEAGDRASLAAFGWALFEGWRKAGMPSKDDWAFQGLAWFGDDTTVDLLTAVVLDWPDQGIHKRAAQGLDVLAGIGSTAALSRLRGIAQGKRFRSLKAYAQQKFDEVAGRSDLTGDQLQDRLVPHLGLDADGSTVVDYGPRRFTVGFDELLRPYVLDQDGVRRKDLPAPNAEDDPVLAHAERGRFTSLKKNARAVASERLRSLGAAMATQRSWSAAEFRELFVQHPLTWHLVRRLVWLAESDGTVTAFRVAEDRSCADVRDEALALPPDATVRLAHPLLLGEAVAAWSELFADYEILQPFPQLSRPVHVLTEEEGGGDRFGRFEGVTLPMAQLLGLRSRGWEPGQPLDGGWVSWFSRPIAADLNLVITLEPGFQAGVMAGAADQTLTTVHLGTEPGPYAPIGSAGLTLGQLNPVMASELISDLSELVAK